VAIFKNVRFEFSAFFFLGRLIFYFIFSVNEKRKIFWVISKGSFTIFFEMKIIKLATSRSRYFLGCHL
jgi:hypothetical protein